MRLLVVLAALAAIPGCNNQTYTTWNPFTDYTWALGTMLTLICLCIVQYKKLDTKRYIQTVGISALITTIVYGLGFMFWEFDAIAAFSIIIAFFARGMHRKKLITSMKRRTLTAETTVEQPQPTTICGRCNQATIGETICGMCGNRKDDAKSSTNTHGHKRLRKRNMN